MGYQEWTTQRQSNIGHKIQNNDKHSKKTQQRKFERLATRISQKTVGKLRYSRRVSSYCFL